MTGSKDMFPHSWKVTQAVPSVPYMHHMVMATIAWQAHTFVNSNNDDDIMVGLHFEHDNVPAITHMSTCQRVHDGVHKSMTLSSVVHNDLL